MAKPKTLPKPAGITRGKLITIAVLAAVLVGVLYKQYGGSAAKPAELATSETSAAPQEPGERPAPRVARRAPPKPPVAETIAAATAPMRVESIDQKNWKTPDLTTVIQYDPFALPAAFPQPAVVAANAQGGPAGSDETSAAAADASRLADTVAKLQTELEQLKQRGVHVIVRERDQYVALIGDRTIHVGDEINGFTVTAIRPDGVHVERKVQQ